jgi:KaiC/GvpD/RAD55 family RecA-like ATPase
VFARPEKGKTLFTINLSCGFLTQGLDVLYIGNEEPAEDIRMRFRMRLLQKPKQLIRQYPDKAAEALAKLNVGRLNIAALSPGTFPEIERLVDKYSPKVVVLDQLRNLAVDNDSRTGQLEAAANLARALAKSRGVLVVSVTQAGDSATGKVYLAMNDVDSSKTGIPAAVDLMIGVGGDDQMAASGLLGISLPKNKLSGSHESFTVSYSPITGVIH